MNIQGLRSFSVVAKLENMSRAAETLHVSQSSLSKIIKNIETEAGVPLFLRKGKKLELNQAGLRFLESCDSILAEMEGALSDIRQMGGAEDDLIKICAIEINKEMALCMAEFKNIYSETEYRISSFYDSNGTPDINAFDMIIYPKDRKYDKFRGYEFGTEKYFLAVGAGRASASSSSSAAGSNASVTLKAPDGAATTLKESAGAGRPSSSPRSAAGAAADLRGAASVKALNGRDFIFLNINGQPEEPFRVCTALGIDMGRVNYVDSRELHIRLISSGIGVGFVPEGLKDLYLKNPEIRLLPLTDERFCRPLMVCFKREKHLSERAAAFKNYILTQFSCC